MFVDDSGTLNIGDEDQCNKCVHLSEGSCTLLQLLDAGYVELLAPVIIEACIHYERPSHLRLVQ